VVAREASVKVLELFSGIGGCAAAVEGFGEVVAAVDHDKAAQLTYAHNFDHPQHTWNLAGAKAAQFAPYQEALWWMSPPCQPFTVRGKRRDLDDPRCQALVRVLSIIETLKPPAVAMENVPSFRQSRARDRVLATLRGAGYSLREHTWCSSELGIPNFRTRYYMVAVRGELPAIAPAEPVGRPLSAYLDPTPAEDLFLDPELVERYRRALPVSDPSRATATTCCFTSAYGRSMVYSGSYVRDGGGIRRLAPHEIGRLLHLPQHFRFPDEISRQKAWSLVGNSVSVPVIRRLLATLPNSVPFAKA
jgi:DNA (cytosine-5)-methyltransferase 1